MGQTKGGPAPATGTGPTITQITPATEALGVESTAPVRFGTPEWHALPVTDPRKSRAVWIAAACWDAYWQSDAVAERLAVELEYLDREVRRRVREMSGDLADATDWTKVASEPTHAELTERRAVVRDEPCGSPRCRGCSVCVRAAAVERQGGDYMGRSVRGVA